MENQQNGRDVFNNFKDDVKSVNKIRETEGRAELNETEIEAVRSMTDGGVPLNSYISKEIVVLQEEVAHARAVALNLMVNEGKNQSDKSMREVMNAGRDAQRDAQRVPQPPQTSQP